MSSVETIESYLRRSDLPHEQIDPETWVIQLSAKRWSRIALRIEDPIVLYTAAILDITEATSDKEALYRSVLELNNTLLHCGYALQDERIVLSGAHPLQNLDQNEFQATIDELTMALDNHYEKLAPWRAEQPET